MWNSVAGGVFIGLASKRYRPFRDLKWTLVVVVVLLLLLFLLLLLLFLLRVLSCKTGQLLVWVVISSRRAQDDSMWPHLRLMLMSWKAWEFV